METFIQPKITGYRQLSEAEVQLMNEGKALAEKCGEYIAKLSETYSNQVRKVDAQKFRNAVTNDQFWKSIDVSITRAKEFLTDKEITALSDVIPSVSQGFKLKVLPLETIKKGR